MRVYKNKYWQQKMSDIMVCKIVRYFLNILLLLCFLLFFVACGKQNSRQLLIDTYNETVVAYKGAMTGIEQHKDTIDEESFQIFQELNHQLKEYRKLISTGNRLSKEETQDILDWLKECKKWAECAKQIWSIEE